MSRQQFRHWAAALSASIGQGLAGPAVCLAIQAQLPAHAPGVSPAVPPAALTGVPA